MINKEKIDQIIRELHFLDNDIDINDEELKKIISKMLEHKPNIENKTFKRDLKNAILNEINSKKRKKFDFGILKKIAYFSSWAAFTYAVLSITNPINPSDIKEVKQDTPKNIVSLQEEQKSNSNKTEIKENKITQKTTSQNEVKTPTKSEVKKENTDSVSKKDVTENSKIATISNSENQIENPELQNQSRMMLKSIPTSDDSSGQTGENSTWTDTSEIINSDLWWASADSVMWLMAMPVNPSFDSDTFIKSMETETTDLVYSLRASNLSISDNVLIIKTNSQTDFDVLNKQENIDLIKAKLNSMWFYYELKIEE